MSSAHAPFSQIMPPSLAVNGPSKVCLSLLYRKIVDPSGMFVGGADLSLVQAYFFCLRHCSSDSLLQKNTYPAYIVPTMVLRTNKLLRILKLTKPQKELGPLLLVASARKPLLRFRSASFRNPPEDTSTSLCGQFLRGRGIEKVLEGFL